MMQITEEMIDLVKVPFKIAEELQAKYMVNIKEPKPFVMQEHSIGASSHGDFRMKINGVLQGWSIVGFNKNNPFSPAALLDNPGKGFRAEQKATQPLNWLKVKGEVKPGEVGASAEKPGMFTIVAEGDWLSGYQSVYFHEYFLKGGPFKNWTRIVVRLIKVRRLEPETKVPTKEIEGMWRIMVPKTQVPYYISSRAMQKKHKPPKGIPGFPREWAKKQFPEEYEKWEEWIGKEELSEVHYAIVLTSYKGPTHIRDLPQYQWYLLLDDRGTGSIRTFGIEGNPLRDNIFSLWELNRVNRKWLTFEGKIKPGSPFNPTKVLVADYSIVAKGTASYDREVEDGVETIKLKLRGTTGPKGEYQITQEEKGADIYTMEKLSSELHQDNPFVLQRHYWDSKEHWDIRVRREVIDEWNLWKNPLNFKTGDSTKAVRKTCDDPSWMDIREKGTERKVGPLLTKVDPLDDGTVSILEENPHFISMEFHGKKLKGYFILKRTEGGWIFQKAVLPKAFESSELQEGNPRGKPFEEFPIVEREGWNHFDVHLYDLRFFTRCEPQERVKAYLPDLEIPEGVTIFLCLYPVPGTMHHTRIAKISFKSDRWTHDKAIAFIRSKRLYSFDSPQIKVKKSE